MPTEPLNSDTDPSPFHRGECAAALRIAEGQVARFKGGDRFFQRPDVDYVTLDTNRTDMTGWVARSYFEKNSGEHWLWSFGAGFESPRFELNDAGRLGSADDIDSWGNIRYRQNEPGSWYHNYQIESWTGLGWNFGGSN